MDSSGGQPRLTPLTNDLRDLLERSGESATSIAELLDSLGERATAALIILLAAPFVLPIPLPGLSIPFGIAIGLLGIRLGFGKPPWLPAFVLRRRIEAQTLRGIVRAVERVVKPIERRVRPHWSSLASPTMHVPAGIAIAIAAVMIMPPIPVPGFNAIPALAIVLYAFGLMEGDGRAVAAGYAVHGVAFTYFYVWWDVALRVMRQVVGFLGQGA